MNRDNSVFLVMIIIYGFLLVIATFQVVDLLARMEAHQKSLLTIIESYDVEISNY